MGQFLVLDLDETLIANSFRFAKPSQNIKVYTLPTEYGFEDRFIVRPFVKEFLSWCSKHFDHVVLSTFSPESRAERVLEATGLRSYFDLIIHRHVLDMSKGLLLLGGEPEATYDMGGDFCLVDDQSWNSDHVLTKMSFLGVDVRPVIRARIDGKPLSEYEEVEKRFLQAPAYEGDPSDDFLIRLLEAFKNNYEVMRGLHSGGRSLCMSVD